MRNSSLLALFILLTCGSAAFAAGQPPGLVTHEDVWLMKRLGAPVVSPDGRYAIVSVAEPSYDDAATVSDLWLVAVDGKSAARRLTSTLGAEGGVDWSPDGKRIAFSAKRDGDEVNQIYVLNMDGPGEAVRITTLSTGASTPKWSPDGSRLAFESQVYPGAMDDAANAAEKKARGERKYNVSAYEMFPIRQWDTWRDDLQTHVFVQQAMPGALAQDLLAGSDLVKKAGFNGVESLSGDSLLPAWTPDGSAIVFSATDNLDTAAFANTTYQLYKVPASGGEVQQLAASAEWSCSAAAFSADGKYLYCLFEPASDHVYSLVDIARFAWRDGKTGGAPQIITAELDRPVDNFDLSADGKTIYLVAADAGRTRIYSVPAAGGPATALDPESRGVYNGVQVAGRQLVAKWESSETPAELVRVSLSSGKHGMLSEFNAERAATVSRPAFREFWFENDRGMRIHNWVTVPGNFDESKKYPLVLMIHGGPFSTSLDADHVRWSPHLLASFGYVVLQTDYTGSVGYGVEFSRRIQGDPLQGPGEDLLQAAAEAIRLYPFIDASRQAATGASYGGHLVNWLQARTKHFKTLVGHAGLVDLEGQYSSSDTIYGREIMNGGPAWQDNPVWKEQSPSTYAGEFSTPILLTIGEKDFRVPINQTVAAWSYVQRMQVPGRLLVFHDANHWIMKGEEARYYWQEVENWLGRYLGDSAAGYTTSASP